jgi:citrate lyase beta subunit
VTDTKPIRPRRSFLFAPGNRPDMFDKAVGAKPDIFCIDLEDAIAPQHKDAARRAALDWFAERAGETRTELLVRVNCLRTRHGLADILALLERERRPDGIMLPKVKSAEEIAALDELLTGEGCDLRLQVIVETNEALDAARDIACSSRRIDALLFGGIDMAADLRVEPTWNALLYARTRLVHAAASAAIDLIDVPYLDLDDLQGLGVEASRCAEIGMTGKGAIHPKQLPVIEEIFTPSAPQIAHARRVVAAFAEADTGLVVLDGKLIEKPVLRKMHRILAVADHVGM